jgi:hypothetical protein
MVDLLLFYNPRIQPLPVTVYHLTIEQGSEAVRLPHEICTALRECPLLDTSNVSSGASWVVRNSP